TLRISAPPGAGCSTLLRKSCWEASLFGKHTAYVDEAVIDGGLADDELAGCGSKQAILFFDAGGRDFDGAIERILKVGAGVVRIAHKGEEADLEVRPLDAGVMSDLLQGALPGRPESLESPVVQRLGGHPGPRRRLARAAQGVPVATK